MQEFIIHLHSVRDVNEFVALSAPLCSVTLSDGSRSVDGKSFMEIFCLQLSSPSSVLVESTDEDFTKFRADCAKFAAK